MKKFPAHDKDELQNVLEANSCCLEDAIAAMEVFSSPEKKMTKLKHHRKKVINFDEVVEQCIVIDDSDTESEPAFNGNNTAQSTGEFTGFTSLFYGSNM